jgi:dienelactone hydrolase
MLMQTEMSPLRTNRRPLSRRELFPAFFAGAISLRAGIPEPRRVTLRSSDGVSVYAWHYPAADKTLPAILLFHQAGSNHAEYAAIAPRLAALGYHSIAIDQRSGGRMWGQSNRTAGEFGKDPDYRAALPDLEAALEWPPTQGLPPRSIVWGSSYSAALVFLLAAKHPSDVEAVMAFSPGEYLGDNHSVRDAAAKVRAPVFITCARDSEEVAAARAIAGAVPGALAVQFVPKSGGVHGSSTLRRDRNPVGAEENWQAVEKFLAGLPRSRQTP